MTAKEFLLKHTHQSNEENLIEFAKLMARISYNKGWKSRDPDDDDIYECTEDVITRDDFLENLIK